MPKLYLNKQELKKVKKIKHNSIERCRRRFESKKLNHLNSNRWKAFCEKYLAVVEFSEHLYEIKFKSSFAIYLYLYLKSQAKPYPLDSNEDYSVSAPVEINFEKLVRMTKMCRNTMRKAFWELVRVGLLLYKKDFISKHQNLPKQVLLLNDKYLIGYDESSGKVVYSINSQLY